MNDLFFLCQCNNCNRVMYDENPQTEQPLVDITKVDVAVIHPMELLVDDLDSFWSCSLCETDSYLKDINTIADINR